MRSTRSNDADEKPGTSLLAVRTLCGVEVHNADGSFVGDIEAVIIDPSAGWVTFAILTCGDWLGSGERYHPVPWSVLEYAPDERTYVISIERATLELAPAYSREELTDPSLPWSDYVRHYYGSPPYWC